MMNKIRLYIVDVVARLRTRASDARRSQDLIRLDAYLTKRPKLGDNMPNTSVSTAELVPYTVLERYNNRRTV
jgi:hypothetical protein